MTAHALFTALSQDRQIALFGRSLGLYVGALFCLPLHCADRDEDLCVERLSVGRLAADSIFNRDFPVLQAIVLLLALTVLGANLLTDIAYAWLDPRIRYG